MKREEKFQSWSKTAAARAEEAREYAASLANGSVPTPDCWVDTEHAVAYYLSDAMAEEEWSVRALQMNGPVFDD